MYLLVIFFFFFKQKTAYEMRISDWSSDVCSSDLNEAAIRPLDQLRADRDVVLVLDLPDDLLDQVLDRHQAVDAAEFVDNQGHVDARQAHLQQQIEHPHRWRHHQDAPHQVDQVDRKRDVEGKGVAVRGDSGGDRLIKKKKKK